MGMRRHSANEWKIGAAALLLVAFALRVYALDHRPLWWDEGLTLTYAFLPPRENLALAVATEHLNPPLFNWLVGAFTSLGGVTVFGARLVSVYGGMVSAAAAYALARRGFGRVTGALTLLLLAAAPMQIYHAQEAKGYTVETAALLLALICWLQLHEWAWRRGGERAARVRAAVWPWWAGYALSTLVAMGTNYLALFAVAVLNLLTAAVTVRAARQGAARRALLRHWGRWLAVQGAGLLPLAPYVLGSLGSSSQGLEETSVGLETMTPAGYLWSFLSTFISSERAGDQAGWWLTVLMLALASAGLLAGLPARWRAGQRLAAAWLLLPLALGYLFHLRYAWFFSRYLLYSQPALLALAALGLARLAGTRLRPAVPVLVTGVLLLSAPLLRQHYGSAPTAEDSYWPELFAAMRPYVREGDGLIARTSWIPGYMRAYLPPAPQPEWILGHFDKESIDETVAGFLDTQERVWQIDYQLDPLSERNDSAVQMRGEAALAYWERVGTASAALFVADSSLHAAGDGEERVSVFANGVHLRWEAQRAVVAPGDVVGLGGTWWTERPLAVWLVRFVHIVDEEGTLVAQIDREPVMGTARSYEWEVGERVADPIAITLPADLPPGRYTVRLGLYDRDTLERVALEAGGDFVVVGELVVR
jgi:mannosyltransferase